MFQMHIELFQGDVNLYLCTRHLQSADPLSMLTNKPGRNHPNISSLIILWGGRTTQPIPLETQCVTQAVTINTPYAVRQQSDKVWVTILLTTPHESSS